MDGWFSGCKCSMQTLKVPGAFVVRNVSTDLTLAGAHRMHMCSTDAAHLQHVSCKTGLCAALVAVAYLKCHQTLKVHLEKDLAPTFTF